MKKQYLLLLLFFLQQATAQTPYYDKTKEGFLVFHPIKTDEKGHITPWYSNDAGTAYDFVINATWNFWDTMRRDMNGLPYYMNHQVWRPINDPRGIGGDQLQMALSAWQLLYQYSGNEKVKENMKFMADYYLMHSLSPATAKWPHLPYPYNTKIYSGVYDGDMVIGKDYTQPDKAGSFGWELVKLYQITGSEEYLQHAVLIANTLALHTGTGSENASPLPFKVNAVNGKVGVLKSNSGNGKRDDLSNYTTNFSGTLELWMALQKMGKGETALYKTAAQKMLLWMKKYPLQNNKWGPFFEDIPGWSDTQINAVTFARFILEHRDLFPTWQKDVRNILDWVYQRLGNDQWKQYGLRVVNEQTAYMTPGNSHTSRQAAAELLYTLHSGDTTNKELAIRQLHWATYMVDREGKNCYPRDEVWLTDGYGDYVRHYLNAMAAMPELAPAGSDHIVHSTSITSQADYTPNFNKRLVPEVKKEELDKVAIYYSTFDAAAIETIRMKAKPAKIIVGAKQLPEAGTLREDSWTWRPLGQGGILTVRHSGGHSIKVFKQE